jgi:curved DNA-binding protein CbpA
MADETYYSLLEVSETASTAEIKAAYLRLIREVHPDRLANAPAYWQRQAEEKSKETNEAFAVLSNSAKRRSYDAQLGAYRRSQSTTSGQTTSQTSAQPPASTSSTKTPHSSSQQYQAASTSATPSNAPSQSSSQPIASRMNAGQRAFFALLAIIFAFGAASAFWASSSIGDGAFTFFLAAGLLFGVACLYQRQMGRAFLALRVSKPKQQLWVTLGTIVLVLLVGKTANTNRYTPSRGSDHPTASSQISKNVGEPVPATRTSDVHYRDQPSLGSGAQHIIAKSELEKITQSQPFPKTAGQPSPQENAQQPILAAAPIAESSRSNGKSVQEYVEAQWRRSLSGSWVGRYNCAQGVTGLTLTIAETPAGGISGIFNFYPVPGGYSFPEGSYSGAVTMASDGSFEFAPQKWISQPSGFVPVALSGHYVAETQRLQGQVSGAIGCTSFDLSRQPTS